MIYKLSHNIVFLHKIISENIICTSVMKIAGIISSYLAVY